MVGIGLTGRAKMRTLTDNAGTVWEVVEAVSDEAAWNAINHARVTGSTGSNHYVNENGVERVEAIVRKAQSAGA
jgi:hypothetical protein